MKLNLNQNWCRLSSPVTRFAKLIENMFNLTFIYIKKGYGESDTMWPKTELPLSHQLFKDSYPIQLGFITQ